eukprot:jgi/Botrbrau1/9481/Bobra.0252s0099.1
MASDGCQKPSWHGESFPYLIHHNAKSGPSYDDPAGASATSRDHPEAGGGNVGTWHGPAPRGLQGRPEQVPNEAPLQSRQPDYVLLSTGVRLPLLGLGTDKLKTPDCILAALEAGYTHIDCAAAYGNEKIVGEALAPVIAEGRRSDLFIVSKVWNDAHRPSAVRESCTKSIADLGCGYLDLYLVHWPVAWLPGTEEPDTGVKLQETWQAMEELVRDGLVKAIGVSNFNLSQVEDLLSWSKIKPVVNQVELHPLLAQRKLVGSCLRKGVQCVAYSGLGHGKLDLLQHPVVVRLAEEMGHSPAQVLLRWNVQRGVPVLARSSNPGRVRENAAGLFEWRLSERQKAQLDALDEGKRGVDKPWHDWGDPEAGGAARPSAIL